MHKNRELTGNRSKNSCQLAAVSYQEKQAQTHAFRRPCPPSSNPKARPFWRNGSLTLIHYAHSSLRSELMTPQIVKDLCPLPRWADGQLLVQSPLHRLLCTNERRISTAL